MGVAVTPEQAALLRAPFPPEAIGQLPKGGTMLSYVGHAATTDRLLQVDPDWTWEPPTSDELQRLPGGDGMRIKLTVCGVTRFGWGDGKNIKEWISDAIRNAAMRFGVALDLWSKEDLRAENADGTSDGSRSQGTGGQRADIAHPSVPSVPPVSEPKIGTATFARLMAKSKALRADKISVADERDKRKLPLLNDALSAGDAVRWETMLDELERDLKASKAPFTEKASV